MVVRIITKAEADVIRARIDRERDELVVYLKSWGWKGTETEGVVIPDDPNEPPYNNLEDPDPDPNS